MKNNTKKNNIIDIDDNKSINFKDIIDVSKDIIDSKFNNFNKEKNIMKNLKILKKV